MAKSRSYGVRDVMNWKFTEQDLPKAWLDHLGNIPERFLMYVDGDAGHGKTEYNMQLSLMLQQYMGKVHYNNVEQGKHVQIQQSATRNNFEEKIRAGKWMYSIISDFDEYVEKISKRNSGRIQIIDSISYWPLSEKQVQFLIEKFRHKSFVFVAYKAHFNRNKPIAHLCDIKVRVENFRAYPSGRFGGNEVFDIWPEKHKKKHNGLVPSLFENGQ
jgi:hypothetical protein